MKLARTYLEMGMLDEAIAALKNAVKSPRQRFEAAAMLGRMYQEQETSRTRSSGSSAPPRRPRPRWTTGRALLYDLGLTLEESGETARALAVFLELQADAGDYRDVAERVERLARVQTGG